MPSYCESIWDRCENQLIEGHTDASWYTKNATSVDFYHGYRYGGLPTCDYTLYLEYQNSTGGWTVVRSHTGYFKYGVTVSFSLQYCPQAYYRVRGRYQMRGSSEIDTNTTAKFWVER
ncbi:hypothetical protein [Bacillus andreraoultii]|uniref:hypothetical protein n=1 Tax=Bacillus andreraoultii TaxID=1499685 RepID=UPI00067E837C|nr:hypothetical protein [Bacillus andreraoultii]